MAKEAEEIAAKEFPDAGFGIAALEHGFGEEREIANVAHGFGESGSAVEVGAEGDVVFADEFDGAVDDFEPIVDGEENGVGGVDADHGVDAPGELVEFGDGHGGALLVDIGAIPEGLAGLLGAVFEHGAVVELVADLEADDAAFGGELFQEGFGHGARDVVEGA